MATTAVPPPGAVSTNGSGDPFNSTPTQAQGPLRYAAFDSDQFSLYVTNSPASAKRALEAHLRDTDRRIQDASKLGTTLVQQRKDLAARLQEVEQVDHTNEIPKELHSRLAELEREYNEVGRESARAFLPKSRGVSEGGLDASPSPAVLAARSGESPTKLAAPSRRQRNQPSNRVHDIEFATEISTSLLAQVRQLQAALSEKDGALKEATASQALLESETTNLIQRIRHMDEIEQKYKDENWNLETRLQELEADLKDKVDKEGRLAQALKSTQSDTAAKERELDDLKAAHDRLAEEHAMAKKVQEADIHSLRRNAANHDNESQKLYKRIDELTMQNGELAKAVSKRWSQGAQQSDTDFVSAEEGLNSDENSPEHSPSASPIKGTPARHGMLESETLKSSLNHAHRMIQNLKNNIHREKTEKIELKRMLQDARDEIEARRGEGGGVAANLAKKRRNEAENSKFKKPQRPDRLGAARSGTTEILEDEQNWEDEEIDELTPSKPRAAAASAHRAFTDDTEATDAFETANERDTTESEAFQTGAEDFDDNDTEGDLTETEGGVQRSTTVKGLNNQPRNRASFLSTASTSAGEEEDGDDVENFLKTPERNSQQPKYRLRLNRGPKRGGRVDDLAHESPSNHSPSSSFGTPQLAQPMQSLGDELDGLEDDSVEGTPASSRMVDLDTDDSPATQRHVGVDPDSPSKPPRLPVARPAGEDRQSAFFAPDSAVFDPPQVPAVKPQMVDAGIMTEPWTPTPPVAEEVSAPEAHKETLRARAGDLIGGALAGFGLGKVTPKKEKKQASSTASKQQSQDVSVTDAPDGGVTAERPLTAVGSPATPATGATHVLEEPMPRENLEQLDFSSVSSQETVPISLPEQPLPRLLPKQSSKRLHELFVAGESTSAVNAEVASAVQVPKIEEPVVVPDAPRNLPNPANPNSPARMPLGELSSNVVQSDRPAGSEHSLSSAKPSELRTPMSDEGSQTLVSGSDIDDMVRNGNSLVKSAAGGALAGVAMSAPLSAISNRSPRRSIDSTQTNEAAPLRTPKRPTSAGSVRSKIAPDAPPLPSDHTERIAAAAQHRPVTPSASASSSMGPPLMPASAYRSPRPKTPAERVLERGSSRDGTTPRPMRLRDNRGRARSPGGVVSHRTSMSSFASELDERFNINKGQIMYPHDIEPAADPRMIQAITQTMIGEYLWKYTRKTGRSETSNTRHRRFFWVHPYTRTLYWSEQDPSTAGRSMLKAKSVAIDAVRVVSDDNAFPPGLHRKSLVVVTPGREVVFTAPTSQRHETWFNALSYLLLRTEQEKNEAQDTFNNDEMAEPNASLASRARRSLSRAAGRQRSTSRVSHASLSSYNSRTTRNSSPRRADGANTRADRRKSAIPKIVGEDDGAPKGVDNTGTVRASNARESNSVSARFSSIASRFRPASRSRSSLNAGAAGDPAQIYDASIVSDSAEDLRAVIAQQERDADRLENVRACCDGKHDVGSLSRTGRHASIGNRFSTHSMHPPRPKS